MTKNGKSDGPDLSERLGMMPGSLSFLRRPWLFWPMILVLLILFALPLVTTYVRPNQLGVLRIKFGPNKGIKKKVYHAGLHLVIPGWELMYRFPKNLQTLQWTKNWRRLRSSQGYRIIRPIRIQTSEGYNVQTDLTIQYRIVDPYKVMTLIGPGALYEDSALIPRSEKILRLVLGELNAEEFYRGPKRIQRAIEAKQRINQDLKSKGIEIVAILVKEFKYDDRYQRMIESRKLQDQRVFLQQAEKLATIQQYRKRVITAQGKARVREELARGEKEVARVDAAAELYRRQRIAQGQLLRKLAEARGIELKNRALEGAGSRYLVALRLAEVLQGIQALILPSNGPQGFNPLNFAQLLKQVEALPKSEPRKGKVLKKLKLPQVKPPQLSFDLKKFQKRISKTRVFRIPEVRDPIVPVVRRPGEQKPPRTRRSLPRTTPSKRTIKVNQPAKGSPAKPAARSAVVPAQLGNTPQPTSRPGARK